MHKIIKDEKNIGIQRFNAAVPNNPNTIILCGAAYLSASIPDISLHIPYIIEKVVKTTPICTLV